MTQNMGTHLCFAEELNMLIHNNRDELQNTLALSGDLQNVTTRTQRPFN